MKYWVDAYNLIGQMESIALSHTNKEERLIGWFNKYLDRQDRCVLVFDGQGQFEYSVKSQHNKVEVVYTDPEQSADEFLIQKMQSILSKNAIWVSSDRQLITEAKRYQKKCLKCDAFLKIFLRRKQEIELDTGSIGSIDEWLEEFR